MTNAAAKREHGFSFQGGVSFGLFWLSWWLVLLSAVSIKKHQAEKKLPYTIEKWDLLTKHRARRLKAVDIYKDMLYLTPKRKGRNEMKAEMCLVQRDCLHVQQERRNSSRDFEQGLELDTKYDDIRTVENHLDQLQERIYTWSGSEIFKDVLSDQEFKWRQNRSH